MAEARRPHPRAVQEETRGKTRNPRVPSAKLSDQKDRYKIKLRSVGYRLVYEVRDREVIVVVVAGGRRDRNAVYLAADKRAGEAVRSDD